MANQNSKSVKPKKQVNYTPKSKSKTKEPMEDTEQENQLRFGGLPDRALKKNLGCG
jgi:hypothetical protein